MSKELPPSRTAEQFVVRFPEGMRDRIAEDAKANNRSMNSEIVARLAQSFELPESTGDSEILLEMRKTQLHLELNTISSQMSRWFAHGQELRTAVARLESEQDAPDALEAAREELANIPRQKKILDVQMAKVLGRLAELEIYIKKSQGNKPRQK